jgi:flavin reductase (DIM6/NTAB) family NADH-FMN oxidoreductase RutF
VSDAERSQPEVAAVEPEAFKQALARLAGGIVVVTATDAEGAPAGLTATSVCSVSLEPPLLLVCLGTGSRTHDVIAASGRYAINVLGAGQASLSKRFARSFDDKFAGIGWEVGRFGTPLLTGALSVCECEVERVVSAGDHTIFIARVLSATTSRPSSGEREDPLLWYRGAHRLLSDHEGE